MESQTMDWGDTEGDHCAHTFVLGSWLHGPTVVFTRTFINKHIRRYFHNTHTPTLVFPEVTPHTHTRTHTPLTHTHTHTHTPPTHTHTGECCDVHYGCTASQLVSVPGRVWEVSNRNWLVSYGSDFKALRYILRRPSVVSWYIATVYMPGTSVCNSMKSWNENV